MEEMQISELNKKILQKGMDDIKKGNVISSAQFWKELKNVWEKKRIFEFSNHNSISTAKPGHNQLKKQRGDRPRREVQPSLP